MARFDVYQNKNAASSRQFLYLLAVQPDSLDALNARVDVPLDRVSVMGSKPMVTPMPNVVINRASWTMYPPELAAIPAKVLSKSVDNLHLQRDVIQNAVDFLFSGICRPDIRHP